MSDLLKSVLVVLLLLTICQLLIIPSTYADGKTVDIGYSRIDPSSSFYFLKSVREFLEIKFAGTEKVRILKRLEFAQRRLREVKSLGMFGREDLVPSNMERFLLEVNSLKPIEDRGEDFLISHFLGSNVQVLIDLYSNLTDDRAKLAVRSTLYRLLEFDKSFYMEMDAKVARSLFLDQKAKFKLGCDLLSKEASSSAVNASEKQVLQERGVRCRDTLSQILTALNEASEK